MVIDIMSGINFYFALIGPTDGKNRVHQIGLCIEKM